MGKQAEKILFVSSSIEHQKAVNIKFSSSTSFLDYAIVLINVGQLLAEYPTDYSYRIYQGLPLIDENSSFRIVGHINRRKEEIAELLKLGRTVFVFMSPPQKCYKYTGQKIHSGTGKNRQTTNSVEILDITETLFGKQFETIEASGSSIEFVGSDEFSGFWASNKDIFTYHAYFAKPTPNHLFAIKSSKKPIGAYFRIGNGNLVFLPQLNYSFRKDSSIEEIEDAFVSSLFELTKKLQESTGDYALPDWANTYYSCSEKTERERLANLEETLASLNQKISTQKVIISTVEKYKLLFTGTGKAFESQVRQAMQELGFKIEDTEISNRSDLVAQYHDKFVVCEVKGVGSSAAEKHAAQLEKWVSEHIASNGTRPKGILIINTYKDTPLLDRKESDFPNQMLPYSIAREHCLMTGLQLFSILVDIRQNPERRHEIASNLLATNGVYSGHRDWQKYLLPSCEVKE